MIDHINWIGEWLAPLVAYPFIGLVVVIAGWSVGEVVQRPSMTNWDSFTKYIQLFILGFIAVAIVRGEFAAPFLADRIINWGRTFGYSLTAPSLDLAYNSLLLNDK